MERLRQYLDDESVSQTELARRLGVKQPTVWEWLNGESSPSAENLQKLSRVTGVSIDELLSHVA